MSNLKGDDAIQRSFHREAGTDQNCGDGEHAVPDVRQQAEEGTKRMGYAAEIVTYRITTDEEEYFRLREAAILDVKRRHPGLISVPFASKREDGSWFDVWIYETLAAAQAANDDTAELPEFLKFFAVLENVAIEITDFPPSAANPLA
ncbi:hypothetical protein [Mycobacterium sp.]|uniref:hypothetical protein n=1 Tax=Mycobacterium sp. TaxID=1785 RepID=UPI002C8C9F3B|nr:hypothetical protein [Mycobacterium sp.]HKP42212.1 hypothetical protein [Mycobacterium sp.]